MYKGESIRVGDLGEGLVELCFDRRNEAINKFDRRTVEELAAASTAIRAAKGVRGVLVTSAKDVFIVGADIFEFVSLFTQTETQIAAHIGRQNASFTAFDDLPVPTVTAINGVALGGGLEMTLASDYRVLSQTAQVGVPEVNLGLFPGYGGTVRLPRIAGAAVAVEWISTGKPRNASAAQTAGVVDAVAAPEALRDTALELLRKVIESGEWRQRRTERRGPFKPDSVAFERAKSSLAREAVHLPAALHAVELMERAASLSRDEALVLEHEAFARIARTQAANSLVQLFISDQMIRKKSKAAAKVARPVKQSAVVGAGIMGGGIAYISAVSAIPSRMQDIAQGALDLGETEARRLLAKQVESGRMTAQKAEAVLGSIQRALDYNGLQSADVVVEAVVENLGVKHKVLAQIESAVRPDTVIASNTSSLSITAMAARLQRPANFVGMHFFNPVPAMPLVEVVRAPMTGDAAAATIVGFAAKMGKTPIVVKDCPGFLVNRILIAYLLGYLYALRDGADYLAIDRAMEAFGWPMGPGYLSDVIGMDTLLHVVETISAGYPGRMRIDFVHAVKVMVERKRLGQKSGAGFYRYESDQKGRPRKVEDAEVGRLLAGQQQRQGAASEFTVAKLQDRLMLPLIIEAAICLEEGIAESAAEIDMALVLGVGFPRYAGGPLKYADWVGLGRIIEACESNASLGPLYAPTEDMRNRARTNQKFY